MVPCRYMGELCADPGCASKSACACGFGRQGYALYRRAGGERPRSGFLVVMDEGGSDPAFPVWGRAGPADLRPGRLRWSWPRRFAPPCPLHGLDGDRDTPPGVLRPSGHCPGHGAAQRGHWHRSPWGHRLGLLGRFWAVPVSRMAGRIWGTAWIAAQFQAVGAVPWLPMLELAVRIRAAVPVSLVWMETGTRWPCAQIGHIPRCCPAGARPQCRLPYPVCLNFPIGEFFSHTRGHGVSVDLFLKLFWGGGRVSPYGATRAHMATCGCAPAHKRPSADVASHKKTCEKSAKKPPLFCIS